MRPKQKKKEIGRKETEPEERTVTRSYAKRSRRWVGARYSRALKIERRWVRRSARATKRGPGVGVRKKAPRLKRKGGRPRDSRAESNVSPHCRAHCRLWRTTSLPPPVRRHLRHPLPNTPDSPYYPLLPLRPPTLLPTLAIWLVACIATCLPDCLPAWLPAYLPIYLLVYLSSLSFIPTLRYLNTYGPHGPNYTLSYVANSLLFSPSQWFVVPTLSPFSVSVMTFSRRSFAIKLEGSVPVCRTGAPTHALIFILSFFWRTRAPKACGIPCQRPDYRRTPAPCRTVQCSLPSTSENLLNTIHVFSFFLSFSPSNHLSPSLALLCFFSIVFLFCSSPR